MKRRENIFKYKFIYYLIIIFIPTLFFGYFLIDLSDSIADIQIFSVDSLAIFLGVVPFILNVISISSLIIKSQKNIFLLNLNYLGITLFLSFSVYIYSHNENYDKALYFGLFVCLVFVGLMSFLVNNFRNVLLKSESKKLEINENFKII